MKRYWLAGLLLLLACGSPSGLSQLDDARKPTEIPASCVYHGVLPDPVCTPGDIDQTITQSNIHQTICVPGWLDINRPRSDTSALKVRQMQMYSAGGDKSNYEEDHLISRELGGSNAATNLWPEPGMSPNPKDAVENKLHDALCADKITLADAQKRISKDWTTALNGLQ